MRKLTLMLSVAALAAGSALSAGPAFAGDAATVNWSQVPAKSVPLFFPGQSSYQWLRSKEHKRADRKTEEGDSCISCHEGEEQELGEAIVGGGRLEPHPKAMGWPRLHSKVWDDGQPAIYEDRFSIMIDDGSVPMFAEQGCWLSCHDGMRDMQDLVLRALSPGPALRLGTVSR